MIKNRTIVLLLFMLTGLCFFSCSKQVLTLPIENGTFIGHGEGHEGPIDVEVIVSDGKVSDAIIIHESETPQIAEKAEKKLLTEFINSGRTDTLDVVTGATMTSNGLIAAFEDALREARGQRPDPIKYANTECDIVIVGAGGAGLVAATEAASKGAKVIVLEKMGIVGGNTNSSTGGINAAYTKEQKAQGITDSREVFFDDTMKGGKYINDVELVHTLVENSADIVEWLQSPIIGADLSEVGMFGGATNKRIHRPKGGGAIGAHLVPLLHKAAYTQGAEIRLKNRVIELLRGSDKQSVAGVKVRTDGGEYTIKAKAVILATGGFGANPAMITKYRPEFANFATTNHRGATGDAIGLTAPFNVALTQMEQIQTHPTVVVGSGIMITESVRGNGAILVNRKGQRFVNEMETRDFVSTAILCEEGGTAFLIFDEGIRKSLKAIEDYAEQGLMNQGATVEELAAKVGIDPAGLAKTLTRYNSFVAEKKDGEFLRNVASMERTISQGPFYAIEVEPAIHHTMGGLKINKKAEVQNKTGQSIVGLYAAGEVTGGIHGATRLGGNAVADICIFGKIAADSAVDFIHKMGAAPRRAPWTGS